MTLRKDEIQAIVDLVNDREEISFICRRVSTFIGNVLSIIEMALPEGKQCFVVKRQMQNAIYDGRNDILKYFYTHNRQLVDVDGFYDRSQIVPLISEYKDLTFIDGKLSMVMTELKQIMDITFSNRNQYVATHGRVVDLLDVMKMDFFEYFYNNWDLE